MHGDRLGEQHQPAQPVGRAQELGEAVAGERGHGGAGRVGVPERVLGAREHRPPHGQPRVARRVVAQRGEGHRVRVAALERQREPLHGVLLVGVVAVAAVELDRLLGEPLALVEPPREERDRRLQHEQAPAVVGAAALRGEPLEPAELLGGRRRVARLERVAQPQRPRPEDRGRVGAARR